MFCRNCGTEMSDTARFCPKCGYDRMGEIQQKKEIVEDNNIKYQVKPKFNIPYKILSNGWRALLYTLLLWLYIFADTYDEIGFLYPIIFIGILVFMVMYIIIKLIFEALQYKSVEYNFYTTKVEYIDGFLNKEEKELKYRHIREVTMNQSILERLFDIGTIRIYTNASSGGYGMNGNHNNMRGRNGIYIHCVENVQEQYRVIKQIIDEGTEED